MLRQLWPPSFRTVVILCAIAVFAAVGTGMTVSAPALMSPASVAVLREHVFVRRASGPYAVASDGEMLHVGDRVRTGAAGVALITYLDGSTVRLEPNTEIVIEAVEVNSTGRVIVLILQTAGRAWYTIAGALSPSSRYEVRTAATAAVVRAGSTVQVDVAGTGDTTVVALNGSAETGGDGSTVNVSGGTQTVVAVASTPAPLRPAAATPAPVALVQPSTGAISAFVPKLDLPTLPSLNAAGKAPPGQQKDKKQQRPGRA